MSIGTTLVTGATGLLGKKVFSYFSENTPSIGLVNSRDLDGAVRADITDEKKISSLIQELSPALVIHCAAWPDIDPCEQDPARAELINTVGSRNVARACEKCGSRLIHISTDYVFDGEKQNGYSEEDEPSPLQAYGRTKLAAEREVLQYSDCLVVRVPFLFGWNDSSDKMTWPRQCATHLNEERPFKAENSQVRQPTLIDDVAAGLMELAQLNLQGILHYSGQEAATKYTWACLIAELMGKDLSLISPYSAGSDEVPRPTRAWLKNNKARALNLPDSTGVIDGTISFLRSAGFIQ